MSSILDALEREKRTDTKEVVRGTQLTPPATPPNIRAGFNKRRLLAVGLTLPVVFACMVAAALAIQTALREQKHAGPERKTATVAHLPTTAAPEIAAATAEDARVKQLTRDLAMMRQTVERMMAQEQARAALPPPALTAPPYVRPAPPATSSESGRPDVPVPAPDASAGTVARSGAEGSPGEAATVEPSTAVESSTADTPVALAVPAGRAPEIELDGIAAGPDGLYAVVQGQILAVGDTCGDWEITEIGNGYIRVNGWDRKIYVH